MSVDESEHRRKKSKRADNERDYDNKRNENKLEKLSSIKDEENLIKAQVSESNGEISCSLEETNRIRAALGLKPLNLNKPNKEKEAVDNLQAKRALEEKEKEEKEIREKLEKSKNKRLLHAKLEGTTLSETKDEESTELLSAADWVRRSRKKELTEKEKAKIAMELAAKRLEEEEQLALEDIPKNAAYRSKDLAGLQVMHDVNQFEVNESTILTLADSSVLDKDDKGKVIGVNEGPDVLENVNLADEERRLEREKIKKRAKQPVYAGYDDAEFAPGVLPGTRTSILSQYDIEKKSGPKLQLGSDGGLSYTSQVFGTSSDGIGLDNDNSNNRIPQSLRVEKKELAEYYTPAEMASFAKPKKEKKKRKIRKKEETEDLEAMILEQDMIDGSQSTTADRGSRATVKSITVIASELEKAKKESYDVAVRQAEQKVTSKLAVQGNGGKTSTSTSGKSVAEVKPEVVWDEEGDDAEIAQSLARARRLALQQQRKLEDGGEDVYGDSGAAHSRAMCLKTAAIKVEPSDSNAGENGTSMSVVNGELDADGRRENGSLVFTSTTEFTARLEARLNEKARSMAEAVVREQELHGGDMDVEEGGEKIIKRRDRTVTATSTSTSTSTRGGSKSSSWKDLMDTGDDEALAFARAQAEMEAEEGNEDEEEEEEEVVDEQLGFVHKQPLVRSGMAATLALLKSSGDLTAKAKDELAGRANDERVQDPSAKDHGVKLEYRDEFGRKLTQKEAFRQLSYRFHGHGPGRKKAEKRLREMENQHKSATSKDPFGSGTMRSLTRAQEATGKAHITIQGGVNASDLAHAVAKRKAKAEKESKKAASKPIAS